jgi:hypothetical protein
VDENGNPIFTAQVNCPYGIPPLVLVVAVVLAYWLGTRA